ncbi:MAG: Clp protease ClpP [Coriobacteriaceae bacterium]|nr:Clp protease ClpP [Coriobacteriaceae bacterium]
MPNYSVLQLVTDTVDPTTARMTIFGDIARGGFFELLTGERDPSRTEALDVVSAIQALPATARSIEVHINSFGGDVSEGVAIYNALRESGRDVTTVCDGFACSIASVVFMAGSRRVMRPASLLMLHNPLFQRVGGNARQLRKAADDLDVIAELSKTAYLTGTSIDAETLDAVMDAETWVDPQQAIAWGLATEVEDAADDGAPTQGARQAAYDALTGLRVAPVVAEVTLGREQLADVARMVAGALVRQQPTDAGPEQETEAGPQPDPEPAPARGYARMAALLAGID